MRIIFCLMVFLFIGKNTMLAQQLSSFVEYGAALHLSLIHISEPTRRS